MGVTDPFPVTAPSAHGSCSTAVLFVEQHEGGGDRADAPGPRPTRRTTPERHPEQRLPRYYGNGSLPTLAHRDLGLAPSQMRLGFAFHTSRDDVERAMDALRRVTAGAARPMSGGEERWELLTGPTDAVRHSRGGCCLSFRELSVPGLAVVARSRPIGSSAGPP